MMKGKRILMKAVETKQVRNACQIRLSPGRNFNQALPEYEV
jgi:hypothetical protein